MFVALTIITLHVTANVLPNNANRFTNSNMCQLKEKYHLQVTRFEPLTPTLLKTFHVVTDPSQSLYFLLIGMLLEIFRIEQLGVDSV